MARILGRAGSGGALRWACAGKVRIRVPHNKRKKRGVPRRIACLQTRRSTAAPLQDTGFGNACAWDLKYEQHSLGDTRDKAAPLQGGKLDKGGDAGYAFADYEFVDVVGAFVGGDTFEVVHVAHDGVIIDDAVGAQNVSGFARGVERDSDIVHLEHGDVGGIGFVFIFEAADVQREQLAFADFRDHPSKLVLHEL